MLLGSWWMFLVFFILFVFDLYFLSFFLCFYVFFMFNLFLFCFGLFSGQTSQVKPSQIKTGSVFYTLFVFFFQCFELLCWEPLPLKAHSQFTLLVNNDLVEWFCFCFCFFFYNYLQLLSRKHRCLYTELLSQNTIFPPSIKIWHSRFWRR